MAYRKPCRRCGVLFQPNTPTNFLCDDCRVEASKKKNYFAKHKREAIIRTKKKMKQIRLGLKGVQI